MGKDRVFALWARLNLLEEEEATDLLMSSEPPPSSSSPRTCRESLRGRPASAPGKPVINRWLITPIT